MTKRLPSSGLAERGDDVREPERRLMDFEAYYDSSGSRADQAATTLAGVAAPKQVWDNFKPLWQNALDESKVPNRRFGMADLMASQGRFKGWDGLRKNELLTALLKVLAKCTPAGMAASSCTVFFHAYDAANARIPNLRKLEAICVNHCVGGLQLKAEHPEAQTIDLYLFFDRNERFLKTVDQVWRQLRKKKKGWAHQVRGIQIGSDSDYGIQAADLWGDPQPTARLSFTDMLDRHSYLFTCAWMMLDHRMQVYYDASQIIEDYDAGRK